MSYRRVEHRSSATGYDGHSRGRGRSIDCAEKTDGSQVPPRTAITRTPRSGSASKRSFTRRCDGRAGSDACFWNAHLVATLFSVAKVEALLADASEAERHSFLELGLRQESISEPATSSSIPEPSLVGQRLGRTESTR
jgi:hypothetical protein